jgi:hypothetical protein
MGDDARNQRLRVGVLGFAATVAAAAACTELGVGPWWRILFFVPFLISSSALYSALYNT